MQSIAHMAAQLEHLSLSRDQVGGHLKNRGLPCGVLAPITHPNCRRHRAAPVQFHLLEQSVCYSQRCLLLSTYRLGLGTVVVATYQAASVVRTVPIPTTVHIRSSKPTVVRPHPIRRGVTHANRTVVGPDT